jgi:hypothetical protein
MKLSDELKKTASEELVHRAIALEDALAEAIDKLEGWDEHDPLICKLEDILNGK